MKRNKIIMGIVILIVIVGIGTYYGSNQKGEKKAEIGTKEEKREEVIEKRKGKKTDRDVLAVSMEQVITLEKGSAEGVFNIENLPENNYDVAVEITDEKRDVIYRSEKIEPGMIIRKDTLHKKLKKGDYLCSATFIAYDEKGNEVKRASAQIMVKVK